MKQDKNENGECTLDNLLDLLKEEKEDGKEEGVEE